MKRQITKRGTTALAKKTTRVRETYIQVRMTIDEKLMIIREAERRRQSVSDLLRDAINTILGH